MTVADSNHSALLARSPWHGSTFSEWRIFFGHFLRDPLGIGAVAPSSAAVAQAMAACLTLDRPGAVLELGGGTGSLTRGLLAAGLPPERLITIERAPALARVLRRRFPAARIIEGDARELTEHLGALGVERLATVISSLPIKWFPLPLQQSIVGQSLDLLGEGGAFFQLTNGMISPLPAERLGISGAEQRRVWRNLLPVQIWRYWRPASSGETAD